MIVANMNLHEVYANLKGEMGKLNWKRDALIQKSIGTLKRSTTFPAYVMHDYQVQASKNQYIIYFYQEHPQAPILSSYLCVMFDGNKRYIIKWTNGGIPEIMILTSHFLQRYKERFLKLTDAAEQLPLSAPRQMSANEVAVVFLSRNHTFKPMAIDERINKRIKEYGEYAGEGFLANDGFCFKLSGEETIEGDDPIRISFFTTFMSRDELTESQREAIFEECMKNIAEL